MKFTLLINGHEQKVDVFVGETLFKTLRGLGYHGIKFGSEKGETGADTILLDGRPVNSGLLLTAQAEGHKIATIESLGEHPDLGWKHSQGLHPIQKAFVETGAIQCGYCTPAQILAAKALLDIQPNPTEQEVREALCGVLCRCTGYLKPVQAVLRAAAILRGEEIDPVDIIQSQPPIPLPWIPKPGEDIGAGFEKSEQINLKTDTIVMPRIHVAPERESLSTVGKPEIKVDALKLAQGKSAFVADFEIRGLLYAKVLRSPHAHARIQSIDVSKARAYPGVVEILTYKDIPRVPYSTAGQSDPIPGPLDCYSLDSKVRFVGDRVAFVAAESPEIAEKALQLIEVDYEVLEPVLDPEVAMEAGTPVIHDQKDYVNFADSNPSKNLAAEIRIDIGDVENGFNAADLIIEGDYEVPKVQQAHIEPHVVISYWDEDDRLVIRTSTQVPFHARRILAPVLGLPIKRIRVIKPRIGGGFGGKQEVLVEDIAAHLTIATGRPVIFEATRKEEFIASRSRHPMKIRMKTGVKIDGTITANEMYALSDTGANGAHALTVTGNTGHKAMALYVGDGEYRKNPNIRFYADIVYTNTPPSGAFRGYGVPQGFWAVERHMEKVANRLKIDPIEFRLKNALREGELHPFSTAWSEGREPRPETIETSGLEECVHQGKAAIGWDQKFGNDLWRKPETLPHLRRGIGVALVMQGTAIPYLDMGSASIKLNDDGSFNLLVGATDLGTGSDTVLAQMAAEVLGCKVEDILVYSSDTDFTPFDVGAYASSTTYISGGAVVRAANQAAERMKIRAAMIFNSQGVGEKVIPESITLRDRKAFSQDGRTVSHQQIGYHSLHHQDQEQIMGIGSYVSPVAPPPFAAQFAEVAVDIETGQIIVEKLVMAVDSGVIVNPITASGQIEGGMTQALGYAVCEEMIYDRKGLARETDLIGYHIFMCHEVPNLETIFVETFEPSHPFGVKAVAEIPMDGVAPAVGNAVFHAIALDIDEIPITPEKIWTKIREK